MRAWDAGRPRACSPRRSCSASLPIFLFQGTVRSVINVVLVGRRSSSARCCCLVRVAQGAVPPGPAAEAAPALVLVFAALLAWHYAPLLRGRQRARAGGRGDARWRCLGARAPRVTQAPLADYAGGAAAAGSGRPGRALSRSCTATSTGLDATRHGRLRGPVAAAARGIGVCTAAAPPLRRALHRCRRRLPLTSP